VLPIMRLAHIQRNNYARPCNWIQHSKPTLQEKHVHRSSASVSTNSDFAASRPRRAILFTLCLAVIVATADTVVVNLGLHAIGRAFASSVSDLQWIIDSYNLTIRDGVCHFHPRISLLCVGPFNPPSDCRASRGGRRCGLFAASFSGDHSSTLAGPHQTPSGARHMGGLQRRSYGPRTYDWRAVNSQLGLAKRVLDDCSH
jgi:hypothetical protein